MGKASVSGVQINQRNASHDLIRLITRVAQMYHEDKLGQSRIASHLGLSQARVSRLLKQAETKGIVRTTVHVPDNVHAATEHTIEKLYGVDEVIVVELSESAYQSSESLNFGLSVAVASWLELMMPTFSSVGISSWSSTLSAAINAMRPLRAGHTKEIVQVLGGLGMASTQSFSMRLTEKLAMLANAEANFLSAPGVASSLDARDAILGDAVCSSTMSRFDTLSAVLMGIGSSPPSRLLLDSGNVFNEKQLQELENKGAVGDVCMRFFDGDGKPVKSDFDERVIGISAEQILGTRRRLGVAGGPAKFDAIRGALRGRWLSTLITDLATAEKLALDAAQPSTPNSSKVVQAG